MLDGVVLHLRRVALPGGVGHPEGRDLVRLEVPASSVERFGKFAEYFVAL